MNKQKDIFELEKRIAQLEAENLQLKKIIDSLTAPQRTNLYLTRLLPSETQSSIQYSQTIKVTEPIQETPLKKTKTSNIFSSVRSFIHKINLPQKNLLMGNDIDDPDDLYVFRSYYLRKDIEKITFYNTLDKMPEESWDVWDVSEHLNNTVFAWVADNELFIAADGDIYATSCVFLFSEYHNLKEINFNGYFKTKNITDMTGMFFDCRSLRSLDCEQFDTSSVVSTGAMFAACKSLININLSSFDTSNVKDMSEMFFDCSSLATLNIDHFDASQVTDMHDMFYNCSSLTDLYFSQLDLAQNADRSNMFYGCTALINKNS